MTTRLELFKSIGLSESKAKETIKNSHISQKLESLISAFKEISLKDDSITKAKGTILYLLATGHISNESKLRFIMAYVDKEKIVSNTQIKAALEFFKHNINDDINVEEFEKSCGVNASYTEEQIDETLGAIIEKHKEKIITLREKFNSGALLGEALYQLKWADTKLVKELISTKVATVLAENPALPTTNKKFVKIRDLQKSFSNLTKAKLNEAINPKNLYTKGVIGSFHEPGKNYVTDNYIITPKTMHFMAEHLKTYGKQVRTRFPPEPNGILHVGHAKAINFNFGYAKAFDGITFLRYDDTNPEKEEEKFFIGIQDDVRWLGFTPYQITYASDHFQKLYDIAVGLIKKGLAYVCHQKHSELKGFNPTPSPWKDRPIEESLKLFEDMKNGLIEEGKATLRLKYVMEDGKLDPVAYRIKFSPHHRTGYQWCIYPTYDYTHPLCDSFEGITHSLCTKEFQSHRSMYYWLCNNADVYCPVQWEYGRLNLEYSLVSKRKIAKLIENKVVSDWDDPRLFTLTGLRRRGIPPKAINYFAAKVGVTVVGATLNPHLLDSCVRNVLNLESPRVMAVLDPIKVVILNKNDETIIAVQKIPTLENNGSACSIESNRRNITFGREIFIEKSDFIDNCKDPDFRRLTTTQPVGLKHTNGVIVLVDIIRDEVTGEPTELHVEYKPLDTVIRPAAFIHWVHNPIECEVRLYDKLFIHPFPEDSTQVPGGFLSDINPDSLKVVSGGLVDRGVVGAKPLDSFQFERIGYFCVDYDSTPEKLVFNRTVSIRDAPNV